MLIVKTYREFETGVEISYDWQNCKGTWNNSIKTCNSKVEAQVYVLDIARELIMREIDELNRVCVFFYIPFNFDFINRSMDHGTFATALDFNLKKLKPKTTDKTVLNFANEKIQKIEKVLAEMITRLKRMQ
jgi:hypothetical protein